MAKRRAAEELTPENVRQTMLRGIGDEAAVYLFDQGMMALAAREQANFMTALQLRDAAQWTVTINDLQLELRKLIAGGEAGEKRIAALIRNKQAAEDARRRILDGLLLTPQKKRGRPEGAKPERESENTDADDAWAAFDEPGGDGDDDL